MKSFACYPIKFSLQPHTETKPSRIRATDPSLSRAVLRCSGMQELPHAQRPYATLLRLIKAGSESCIGSLVFSAARDTSQNKTILYCYGRK